MSPKTMIHPDTGKMLTHGYRNKVIDVPGAGAITVEMPGWYPDDDSDSIHDRGDLLELEMRLKAAVGA